MNRILGIIGLLGLTALYALPADTTFYYSGTQNISQVHTVTAKVPRLVTVTNGPVSVAAMTSSLFGATVTRTIQNCGTNAILYCLGGTVATTNYHGAIAGGNAVRDGLGSVLEISKWPGTVSMMTENGTATAAVTELIH